MKNKIYVIGDIHGCHNEMIKLLDMLPKLEENDKVIFLGDYIDRGPDSYKVVEHLVGLSKDDRYIFLKGNHEDMMLEAQKDIYTKMLWYRNGGSITEHSYKDNPIPGKHSDFYNNLKLYYETPDYLFVHAGINPLFSMNEQVKEDLLWVRYNFINSEELPTNKIVVFGHTPFKTPFIKKNKIGIDTGCCFGRSLSCIELPSKKVYSVSCPILSNKKRSLQDERPFIH